MARITQLSDLGKIMDPTTFMRFASQTISSIVAAVNGKLSFSDNFDCKIITATTPVTTGTDFPIVHNLGRPIAGVIPISKNSAVDIWPNGRTSTNNTLMLQASVANVGIVVLVF